MGVIKSKNGATVSIDNLKLTSRSRKSIFIDTYKLMN